MIGATMITGYAAGVSLPDLLHAWCTDAATVLCAYGVLVAVGALVAWRHGDRTKP